ncbi:uncharacterized protein LOC141607950 [Silene latifolia]|uniref:uncharacterized protein LOC141607950 n=1 Tax=Silene latifolia TaxID=37657 RepID=UPI003D775555
MAFSDTSGVIPKENLPHKLKNPESLFIPCTIGDTTIEKALCDLSANVSVMLYSVYEKLRMEELKCRSMTLQMSDHKKPLEVFEDVPVRVGTFFIRVDFVFVDMVEDGKLTIILRRPFFHTSGAVIDVKVGMSTLEVWDEKVTFNLNKDMKAPYLNKPCFGVDHARKEVNYQKSGSPFSDPVKEEIPTRGGKVKMSNWKEEVDEIEIALLIELCIFGNNSMGIV